jgi:uncharacterized cupin superfamily protein
MVGAVSEPSIERTPDSRRAAARAQPKGARSMSSDSRFLIRRREEERAPRRHFRHPFNPNSDVYLRALGRSVGLERSGVTLAEVPPGRESFIYHAHRIEEEWLFIISGSGTAVIDGQEYAVGPGDFMGFPTPSVPHSLVNTGDQDLVYLMGGESRPCEIAEFPSIGTFVIRDGDRAYAVEKDAMKLFWPPPDDVDG